MNFALVTVLCHVISIVNDSELNFLILKVVRCSVVRYISLSNYRKCHTLLVLFFSVV